MSVKRIFAIAGIFILACSGWSLLGTATMLRSNMFAERLGEQVSQLWGIALVQEAPAFSITIPGSNKVRHVLPAANDIRVKLERDYRRKGLIWYPTYNCNFDGTYTVKNTETVAQKIRFHFQFPDPNGTYDSFAIKVNGKKRQTPVNTQEGIGEIVELAPQEECTFQVTYATRGLGEWRYRLDRNVGRVQNFSLVVNTDFAEVDYPDGTLSPTEPKPSSEGMQLTWSATDLITNQDIGVVVPEKLNPGPVASRITFFAPVCLIFFFVLVATINIIYKVSIHPMHYLFVAAGFFAFHLLLAYLVDHMDIHAAFLIAAITSVGLVTTYLSSALGGKFPWRVASAGQIFFLVLFSYSFFLKGITGLTVAVGSVVTLAVLMRVTAHIDWEEVFGKRKAVAVPGR